ncbi:MAG TPA: HAD family hydrolase [Kiritimatiellae bacterium]|nr:HAD family hydrolase [Kiritimatiellia bacterium]
MLRKCVFFDRDGIVNRSPGLGYVTCLEDFEVLPEFIAALRNVKSHGYLAIVVSNQRGVALGKMTIETVDRIHRFLRETLATAGLALDAIYYCPHDNGECDCRKPSPGMLLRAAAEFGIDLSASWMIGDSLRDVVAGKRAGCRTVLVGDETGEVIPDYRLGSVAELPGFLSAHLD